MTVRRYAGGLVLLGLVVSVTSLGAASLGRAGSVPNDKNFAFSVQPQFVTAGKKGFAKGTFQAASGSGTGSATQVVMTFDLPSGFAPAAGTSSGCSPGTEPDNIYSCAIGTVRAGQVVTRFVAFIAPSNPSLSDFSGCVTFDNGSGGAGGGGSHQTCDSPGNTKSGQITVVAAGDKSHGGGCDGSASTASVSADNLQNSALSGAVASPSANVPCPWVVVGVASPSVSNALTQISFTGFPKTDVAAKWTIDFYSLPAPFSHLELLLDKDYTEGGSFAFDPPLPACTGPNNNTLGPGQGECQSLVKVNNGARATLWLKGTGADPGAGLG
jgi:hypothetical protein